MPVEAERNHKIFG